MIEIRHIVKSYRKRKVLDDLNMEIERGDIIGLLGPNGAGKSTLLSILSTLIRPDSGEILYHGQNIFNKSQIAQYRSKIALVPQEIALYENMSGLENLKFFGNAYGLKKEKLTQKIDEIADIIGIRERLSDKVNTYSGGMARRLNIGVALLNSPEILIMDEPTVGIDPQSRNYILECVRDFNKKGMTILYTTHYMEEVQNLCKKLYIMDFGKIILQGDMNEILGAYSAKAQGKTYTLEDVFLELTGKELRD